jgi:hypothetical protein
VRDITKSSIEGLLQSSSSRRLLKLGLTDGHTEITAIEYFHIPSIPDGVVPGTKVVSVFFVHYLLICFNCFAMRLPGRSNCVYLVSCSLTETNIGGPLYNSLV